MVLSHLAAAMRRQELTQEDLEGSDPTACTSQAVRMCEDLALDALHTAVLTKKGIAILANADPTAVGKLFNAVGLGDPESITCQELCHAADAASQQMLGAKLGIPGKGCLDRDCTESIDVSDEVLSQIEDQVDDEHQVESEEPASPDSAPDPREDEVDIGHATEAPDRVLRRALAIIFEIFPAADISIVETEEVSSFMEQASLLEHDRPAAFGRRFQGAEQRRLQQAVEVAIAQAAAAARHVKKRKFAFLHVVRRWLGSNTPEVAKQASKMFAKVVSCFNNVLIVKGKDDWCFANGGTALAFVRLNPLTGGTQKSMGMLGGRHVIHVCQSLFAVSQLSWLTNYKLGRVLVHEATHHFGTRDYAYGAQSCLRLAIFSPQKAQWNADTYSFLSQELMKT